MATPNMNDNASGKRADIIASVSTTLKFFALLAFVSEVVLAIMANSAQGTDRTYLIVGMISTLILMILSVTALEIIRPGSLGNGNCDVPVPPMADTEFFRNNDSPEFSAVFERYFEKATKIHMIGTGFNILRRESLRMLLTERIRSNCELKIYAANPFSPHVQARLIEEEIGKPAPMVRQQGLISWLRGLLDIWGDLKQPPNFSLKVFPFYPTYALFIFDERDYFFYPYGYAQLGTLSPVLHFSKNAQEPHPMVEFFDKQYKFISECSSDAEFVLKIQDGQRVDVDRLTAFAVYLIPPANSELYRFGSEVLGYDVRASKVTRTNKWSGAIGAAADFGFHLTVADALYCSHPKDVDLICREVEFLAKQIQPFTLKFQLEKDFPNQQGIALASKDESGVLESLHHEMVARVYRKAVASNYSSSLGSIARPDRDPNQQRARFMIQRYHAPYVLQLFRPHFSLLSAVQQDKKDQLFADMREQYDKYQIEPEIKIHDIAVMHRPEPNKPWQILKEYRLGGA